ncbi:MAG: ATP-binding protein, partial [Cyanobacteria bacterium J06639_1]
MSLFLSFFLSQRYMPHGQCYLWQPSLVWTHVLSDTLIALSYYSIPLLLVYFIRQRKDIPFKRIFLLFSLFILTCGTTHVLDVWTLWVPAYWVSGAVKAVTAIVSLYTAFALVPVLPQALALPSPTVLAQINEQLEVEIEERKQAEIVIQTLNSELEQRIQKRTEELERSNRDLEAEIAERKRTEIALQQAKETAEIANRTKSDFLANMSHELRTPLNAILGFAQLMAHDDRLSPSQKENLSIIHRSGGHLLELIDDILEMSKIEAGRVTLYENTFDLHALLTDLAQTLRLRAQTTGLDLVLDLAPEVPQYVSTDERKLRQVLMNLLDNAVKFTSVGQVVLRVRCESESVAASSESEEKATFGLRVEVEDTGAGIAADELDALFDPFVQSEAGRRSQQGTGLGLPISDRFVQLMGGALSVSSTLGQGSTFGFSIPVRRAAAEQVANVPLPSSRQVVGLAPGQPRYRILVVEDRFENRKLLVGLLQPLGFEVREAENGRAAIAQWEQWQPHLIWMDLRMPEMDGYEATQSIRSRDRGQSTAIIAITASAFAAEKFQVLSA